MTLYSGNLTLKDTPRLTRFQLFLEIYGNTFI